MCLLECRRDRVGEGGGGGGIKKRRARSNLEHLFTTVRSIYPSEIWACGVREEGVFPAKKKDKLSNIPSITTHPLVSVLGFFSFNNWHGVLTQLAVVWGTRGVK